MPGAQILIVEDDHLLGESLTEVLAEETDDVCWVKTGAEAISALEKTPPDICLLDYRLPDCHGIHLLREIKLRGLDAAVILMTGFAEVPLAVEAMQAGAYTFLVKPLDLALQILALTASASPLQFIPYEKAYDSGFEDMRRRVPDLSKLRRTIGYSPHTSLEENLQRIIQHMRVTEPALRARPVVRTERARVTYTTEPAARPAGEPPAGERIEDRIFPAAGRPVLGAGQAEAGLDSLSSLTPAPGD